MHIQATQGCSPSRETADSLFAKADTDGNKSLSLDEFSALISSLLTPATSSDTITTENDASDETAKQSRISAAFSDFDTDADGAVSESEMKAGLDSLAKTLSDAVASHNLGDSTPLIELLFGKRDMDSSNDDTVSGVSGTPAMTHCEANPDDDAESAVSNATANNGAESVETRNQRLQQWMLNAFVSQFNVTGTTNTAAVSGGLLAAA